MERSVITLDQDRLDHLEQLFILRKFDECLPLSEKLLEQISVVCVTVLSPHAFAPLAAAENYNLLPQNYVY